jgi:hypothetical protein
LKLLASAEPGGENSVSFWIADEISLLESSHQMFSFRGGIYGQNSIQGKITPIFVVKKHPHFQQTFPFCK